jgi:hypothetical protein
MPPFVTRLFLLAALIAIAAAQMEETYQPPGEHPALLLNARRLRLLRRERERQSPRWQQFESLMTGNARMPEPGFALALYYEVAQDAAAGRRAVEWAAGETGDLRQLALVYDWCRPLLSEAQAAELAAKLEHALDRPPRSAGIPEARARVFAALAIADRSPKKAERELHRAVVTWFRGDLAAALEHGRNVVSRGDLYALLEILHAVRDNLNIDLRESARGYFRLLGECELLSYYPASYPAPENEYRIPAVKGGEPDPQLAILARAADLALTAYDVNSVESQFLQGWLMHDRFIMKNAFAVPYEFLWANPYQPGLSYYNAPLSVHDGLLGRLFVRSSWNDDAFWAGYFDGQLQVFEKGEAKTAAAGSAKTIDVGDANVMHVTVPAWPSFDGAFRRLFLVGLKPSHTYLLEPDHREMEEERADPGGILGLDFPSGFHGAIRIREAPAHR